MSAGKEFQTDGAILNSTHDDTPEEKSKRHQRVTQHEVASRVAFGGESEVFQVVIQRIPQIVIIVNTCQNIVPDWETRIIEKRTRQTAL